MFAVASGTGQQSTGRIAVVIQRQALTAETSALLERQSGVIERNVSAPAGVELARDPAHLFMLPAPVAIRLELPFQITRIKSRQARRTGAISPAIKAVAGETRIVRSRRGSAMRNHPSVFRKPVERARLGRGAATERNRAGKKESDAHNSATAKLVRLFQTLLIAPLLFWSAACKPPPEQRQFMPLADSGRGKAVIERVGCGSCHTIPGVSWPRGKVGPNLDGLAHRALIAGKLPNRPDVLAGYIRNAPALLPGSAMPAMPVNVSESRDIAAYLYEQGDR